MHLVPSIAGFREGQILKYTKSFNPQCEEVVSMLQTYDTQVAIEQPYQYTKACLLW